MIEEVASIRPIRPPAPQPVELQAHALDNLRYIRRTMERAGSFTAVPGGGGGFVGVSPWAAAGAAGHRPDPGRWFTVWLAEAVAALSIGIAAAARKSARARIP